MTTNGQISAEEGLQLLQALNGQVDFLEKPLEAPTEEEDFQTALPLSETSDWPAAAQETAEIHPGILDALPPDEKPASQESLETNALPASARKWRRWWMIPLWIGVAITVSGGLLMYYALESNGIGLWFIFASVPFIIGVAIMALAWSSRSAPWLHLRIQGRSGESPERIAFSFPIPIRPTAWFLRTFGHKISRLEGTSLDEIILAVGNTTSPENPIYIQVDEGENGEKVEIFIG